MGGEYIARAYYATLPVPLLRTHPIKCWLDTLFSRTGVTCAPTPIQTRPLRGTVSALAWYAFTAFVRNRFCTFWTFLRSMLSDWVVSPYKSDKGFPEWTHYSHSSPVRRGCIALHARTIAVFTHTIQFCCIIFDNSMLLRYFTHFLPIYAGHGLAKDKAKIC